MICDSGIEFARWRCVNGCRDEILGYAIEARTADALVDEIATAIRGGGPCHWLACLNPHSYALARREAAFSAALRGADWLVPDGVGIVLASRVLGGQITARVTGSDVFERLHRRLNDGAGARVFFLGASEATLAAIRRRTEREYPNLEVVGTYSPPFRPAYTAEEVDSMVAAVNAASPDVLWVGLTAPKQEKWLHANAVRLTAPFAGAVGAVFDFYAGRVRRSHPWLQRTGLEWLPRLLQEPRRLWRRMFVSAPVFLLDVALARLRRRRSTAS
jgi:N-acetylglucosaminyldiphosphoundecaprenol N-acetyl-beta-D-mannosaminyltransferase